MQETFKDAEIDRLYQRAAKKLKCLLRDLNNNNNSSDIEDLNKLLEV